MDGSDASINASNLAIDVAKGLHASLSVLCIVTPTTHLDLGYANVGRMKDFEFNEKIRAQKDVEKVKKKAMKSDISAKVDVVIKHGSVVKKIVDYAEKHKIDLIITGSKGMTGFKKMLLGSVASGVVTYAHCPVLIVK